MSLSEIDVAKSWTKRAGDVRRVCLEDEVVTATDSTGLR